MSTDFGWNLESFQALAIQSNGKIVATGMTGPLTHLGRTQGAIALGRYLADGRLDNGFGSRGKVITRFAEGLQNFATALALQPDGKIVVAGS